MNNTVKNPTSNPEPFVLHRKIGSTFYKVGIHFSPNAKETLNEKVIRMLKNDLKSAPKNVNMEALQAGWLPERGSL